MSRSCSETHASIDAFTSRASSGLPSENETPRRSVSRKARPPSRTCHFSHSAGVRLPRPSVASSVSNTFATISSSSVISSVAGVRERTGLARPTTSLPPRGISSAAASPGRARAASPPPGRRWPSRTRHGGWRASPRATAAWAASRSSPASRARATPFSAQRPASSLRRACQAVSAASSSALAARAGLASSSKSRAAAAASWSATSTCPVDALRLRQQQPGLAFESAVTLPFLVEAVESRLRGAHRFVHAEGVERRPRQAQAVVDRLLGDVPLVEVLDELRAARGPPAPPCRASRASPQRRCSERRLRGDRPA